MPKEFKHKRAISPRVQAMLWGRAAGRCQFNGCNKALFKSPLTHEPANIAEKAHIYSFSEQGPRGWGILRENPLALNQIDNLMLMCHDCHKVIDEDKEGKRYTAKLLKRWKEEHEERIRIVTRVKPGARSHTILYGANVGDQHSPLQPDQAFKAMFPERFPANGKAVKLSMNSKIHDYDDEFWNLEEKHLERSFSQLVYPLIEEANPAHFTVFALAPMPLLIKLGALLSDKVEVDARQLKREPQGWEWEAVPERVSFEILQPETIGTGQPCLVLSLSANIARDRVISIVGEDAEIWEMKTAQESCHNDFMRDKRDLAEFRKVARKMLAAIQDAYGIEAQLKIFPAMPVSCSLELGRIRMPKAAMPWCVYDQSTEKGGFIKALEI